MNVESQCSFRCTSTFTSVSRPPLPCSSMSPAILFLLPEEFLLVFHFFQPVLMMHSLSFCLIGKVFILPLLLEGIFTGNRVLGCKLFSFLFIPWSSAIIISIDKSVINLMVVPLKVCCSVFFFPPKCFEGASLCFSLVSFLNVLLFCTL